MAADFSAAYVRLMQGALIAQLSKDILGEAAPSRDQASFPIPTPAGSPGQSTDANQVRTGVAMGHRPSEGAPPQSVAISSAVLPGAVSDRPTTDVVPDQLDPQMREAANERFSASSPDSVHRLRLSPSASLTLAGLSRPQNLAGEGGGSPQAPASAAAPSAMSPPHEAAHPVPGNPVDNSGNPEPIVADGGSSRGGGRTSGASDVPAIATVRRGLGEGAALPTPVGTVTIADLQGLSTSPDGLRDALAQVFDEAAAVRPRSGIADATDRRDRAAAGLALRGPTDGTMPAQGRVTASATDAVGPMAAGFLPEATEGVDAIRTSSLIGALPVAGLSAATGEAFLAAIAALGGRGDQAVSREMLSAVILNAAMIPGWPFPKAYENPQQAMDARRAAGLVAAAGAEEFRLTPEEMIAYLTSIGANARLLKALQDLFALVEKKDAVKLMAWLTALTSALREIEKSLEDLLRKGTRLPEWADALTEDIRKGLSRRQRYQI